MRLGKLLKKIPPNQHVKIEIVGQNEVAYQGITFGIYKLPPPSLLPCKVAGIYSTNVTNTVSLLVILIKQREV